MLNTYDIGVNKWWQNWHFWQTIPLMVSNHVTVHIHIYAHQVTTMHTQTCTHLSCWYWLTDCMTPRVSLPTPKNENGVEWLMALCSLYWLSMQSRTHIHGQPPRQLRAQQRAGGVLATLMLLPHSSLAQCRLHTHTHTHTNNALSFSLYPLSLGVIVTLTWTVYLCASVKACAI